MAEPRFCAMCGTPFPSGARFCPNCGSQAVAPPAATMPGSPETTASAPPPAATHAAPTRSTYLIWVPLAVIALALAAWAILAGMPFSREPREPERRPMDVVAERKVPTETVARIGDPEAPEDRQPAPVTPQPAPVTPRPAPVTKTASPAPATPAGEISEGEAQRTLEQYIGSRRDYDVPASCLSISSRGYRNAGYTFDVRDRCSGNSLGRWRIDSKDPSGVFRQRADGRFLRP